MKTLLLIDLQNDFCYGGALEVKDGDAVIPLANALMLHFPLVVATQDWHPANHGSFAANHLWRKPGQVIDLDGLPQILWTIHCVQNTFGARFHPKLDMTRIEHITQKGTDVVIDSYSGFFDNGHRKATDLHAYLQQRGATELFVMGLATDYCVKFTVLDALALGYDVSLIEDASRGVNLQPDDVKNAVAEMREKGAKIVQSADILKII
jgi:nicotinamidase/pyrazinamidase